MAAPWKRNLNSMSHAYIITAETHELCRNAAVDIAAEKACTGKDTAPCRVCKNCRKIYSNIHPDVSFISRDSDKASGDILVDTIRGVVLDASVLPNEADCKVYIFEGTMNKSSQNAMLKLLEEGPGYCVFIICTTNISLLLPTVRSRCVEVNVRTSASQPPLETQEEASAADYLSLASGGDRAALLRFCIGHETMDINRLACFIRTVKSLLSRELCRQNISEANRLLELMRTIETYLEFNVNIKHIWGVIAAKTIES